MTLGTHAVVGAALAELFPRHPIIAFVVGFGSHFILDAIPHWDYKIFSRYANPSMALSADAQKIDRLFKLDLLRIFCDLLIGALIILAIFPPHTLNQFWLLAIGAFGAVLPDFLQFVYARFPHQPMVALQKFHSFMHANHRIKNNFIGVTAQAALILIVAVSVKYLLKF